MFFILLFFSLEIHATVIQYYKHYIFVDHFEKRFYNSNNIRKITRKRLY